MKGRQIKYERLQVSEVYTSPAGNLYCLYSFGRHHSVGLSEFQLDPRCAQFGSHFVLIKDLPKFFDKILYALAATGLEYRHGLVRYYDERTYSGPLSILDKPLTFNYQQELRFHVCNPVGEPLTIQLGSLAHIAEMYPVSALAHFKAQPIGYRHVSKGFAKAH